MSPSSRGKSSRPAPAESSFAVSAFQPAAGEPGARRGGKMNRSKGARHNREIVLHMICALGAVSQSEIARQTQLRRSTVFYVLRDLKARGLVCEGSTVASRRVGPKEKLIEIEPKAAWSAGLCLSSTGHQLCLVNAAGHIIAQQKYQPRTDLPGFLDGLPEVMGELRDRWRLEPGAYMGTTVCVPGIVNHDTGVVLNSLSLGLQNYPLGEELGRRLTGRVLVERNAICGAYAERYLGGWGHAAHMLYLVTRPERESVGGKWRYSFGLAILSDGHIYRGSNSASGELHGTFLRGGQQPDIPLAPQDPVQRERIAGFLTAIGAGIGNLVNLFDPQLFIVAGDDELWTDENVAHVTREALAGLTFMPERRIQIVRSTLGVAGVVHGAALLCLHRGLADLLGQPQG